MDKILMRKITILMMFVSMMLMMTGIVQAAGEHKTDSVSSDQRTNSFMDTKDNRLSFLIPMILLFVCLVTFAIDFGAVGVASASIVALIIGWSTRLLYFNLLTMIALIAILAIMAWKMSDR